MFRKLLILWCNYFNNPLFEIKLGKRKFWRPVWKLTRLKISETHRAWNQIYVNTLKDHIGMHNCIFKTFGRTNWNLSSATEKNWNTRKKNWKNARQNATSGFCSGPTTTRLKVVDNHNFLETLKALKIPKTSETLEISVVVRFFYFSALGVEFFRTVDNQVFFC